MENISIEYQAVTPENMHLIRPLAEKIWQKTYGPLLDPAQIDYMLPMMYSHERITNEIEAGYVWELLVVEGKVLGYLDYKLMEDNRVFLSKIYLDTDQQQRGLGKLMLAHVLDFARQHNASSVYLTVNKHNAKAIEFYERNGLQCIESKTFDIGNGYVMDDYIYQIEIE
ncbi:GNAT family N-acetyltransferase [Myroides sp. WP-1]|uniref:GNAT family N-acetyltransferase n=1 Tax=Myroides sp. WP-1 TaxID=2759944 RepID=UPI0015FE69B9|nr:GNAT family N-acetyltransferase [Myroides sp. WP-1]MBB1139148.1 GNAT family N-acetyltransferase [Myroides sp. WP-1]